MYKVGNQAKNKSQIASNVKIWSKNLIIMNFTISTAASPV